MADRSEELKLARAKRQLIAAEVLEKAGLLEQAAAMQWIALRSSVFAWLEQRNRSYVSTRDALVIAITSIELHSVKADLVFAYHIGTMAEWDEDFAITSEQLCEYERRCTNVKHQLTS